MSIRPAGPYPGFRGGRPGLAWALVLCGRFEEALAYVGSMSHPEERLRALYRVTEVTMSHGKKL
jgi:hypothetical protein